MQRDPRKQRVFAIVSRQALVDSKFSTVICAPVYTSHHGLTTQVGIGVEQGLKHSSSIHCDELVSIPKTLLRDFIGSLDEGKLWELEEALKSALELF